MKPTPGPWFAADDGREIFIKGEGDFPIQIAEVVDGGDCADEMQLRADQRLIAAAPDLLEAVIALLPSNLGSLHPDDFDDDFIIPVDMTAAEVRKARAAIAKARGEA